jgi:transcriptional regulator with XRE-family HTH domain
MSVEMIGKQIASIRKEKGIKQDELASYVGVSTQAVSKWENGGVPDTELLPKIADFFSVSVDFLFGRNITDYSDLQTALIQKIIEIPQEEKFKAVFNYCWDIERAMFGSVPKDGSIEDYEKELGKQEQRYSSIMSDHGFTRMGIANRLQYFLLVPEIQNTDSAFFEGIDYLPFFKDFSDKDVFDACVFLNKRKSDKAFTENLLIKNLNVDKDRATQIIGILEKYNLLYKTQIEMDDEVQTVYNFKPTPSFIAFLIFAREMIQSPNHFIYYSGGRNSPYLK